MPQSGTRMQCTNSATCFQELLHMLLDFMPQTFINGYYSTQGTVSNKNSTMFSTLYKSTHNKDKGGDTVYSTIATGPAS